MRFGSSGYRGRGIAQASSGGGGGGSAYAWYSALDLDTIPFHATNPIVAPTAPNITSTSNASTFAALQTACAVAGRQVTITSSFAGGSINTMADDVEIIVPSGIVLTSQLLLNDNASRFRIRGSTVGSYSGGQVHHLRFGGGAWTDIIVDGIGNTGDYAGDEHALIVYNGVTRMAIVNVLMNAGASGTIGDHDQLVVAGCSINTGAGGTPGDTGAEAWGIRSSNTGNVVVYQCDIRGNRFHRIRHHPDSNLARVWTSDNTLVDFTESKFWTVDANMSSHTGICQYAGFIGNRCYGDAGSLNISCPTGGSNSVVAAFVTGNTIYDNSSDTNVDLSAATSATKSGNTYLAVTTAPAWGAAGDPTVLDYTP